MAVSLDSNQDAGNTGYLGLNGLIADFNIVVNRRYQIAAGAEKADERLLVK